MYVCKHKDILLHTPWKHMYNKLYNLNCINDQIIIQLSHISQLCNLILNWFLYNNRQKMACMMLYKNKWLNVAATSLGDHRLPQPVLLYKMIWNKWANHTPGQKLASVNNKLYSHTWLWYVQICTTVCINTSITVCVY